MPERNLVAIFVLALVGLTIVATQVGCSKLRQSTINQDLLGNKSSQQEWSTDYSDSASRYVGDPYAGLEKTKKDSARILDEIDENAVKLVATPAPSLNETKSDSTDLANCDHESGCDCHKPKMKPVLPYAEPIEPPVYEMTPPSGLVSQPLAPIMFNASTRAVDEKANTAPENSLRRLDNWTNEQVVRIEGKQDLAELQTAAYVDSAMAESDSLESDVTLVNSVASELEKNNWRDLEQTEIAQSCATCDGLSCDGSCVSQHRRESGKNLSPVVSSEPIVIVATTSEDTIPPFADHPVEQMKTETVESELLGANLPLVEVESEELELPIGSEKSFDDLTNEEWIAMFGPEPVTQPTLQMACPSCSSSECSDPNCGQSQIAEVTGSNDFQFPVSPSNDVEIEEPTNPPPITELVITGTVETDSSNDFQAVTHLAAVDETNDFAPTEFAPSESTEQKTIELPNFDSTPVNEVVQVADAAESQQMRRPQLYTGPAVRFEVIDIDNTVPWSEKLDETIQSVQSRLSIETEPEARNGLEVNLRLLDVLKRQMVDVEDRKDALSDEEKQYWQHQLDAIALMLNSNDEGTDLDRHNTAINTLDHLRKAVERLESIADLRVSNGEFCTEVSGFGQFKVFPSTTFKSDQRMLVYCEVENYSSVQRQINSQSQVQTQLRGSFAIYDEQGTVVQQSAYPVVNDIARKRRRDFYMHFPIQLNNLSAGKYKLQLLVEDLNGNKSAGLEPGLEFEVK